MSSVLTTAVTGFHRSRPGVSAHAWLLMAQLLVAPALSGGLEGKVSEVSGKVVTIRIETAEPAGTPEGRTARPDTVQVTRGEDRTVQLTSPPENRESPGDGCLDHHRAALDGDPVRVPGIVRHDRDVGLVDRTVVDPLVHGRDLVGAPLARTDPAARAPDSTREA